MKKKCLLLLKKGLFLVLIFIFQFAYAQEVFPKEFQAAFNRADSIKKSINLKQLIEHDFVGEMDSIFGSVKGKVFLNSDQSEIKHVQFYSTQKKVTIQYFSSDNKLILIEEPDILFIIYTDKIYKLSISNRNYEILKATGIENHLMLFKTIKNLWTR